MKALAKQISELDGIVFYGRVVGVRGLMVEIAGPLHAMSVGARIVIETPGKPIPCEVVGFSGGNALLMPLAPLECAARLPGGGHHGCRRGSRLGRPPGARVNALGEPIDGEGALRLGPSPAARSFSCPR
jgi:flagellum-specific ATP synthase